MRKHSSFCEKPTLLKTNKLRPSKMLGLEFPAIPNFPFEDGLIFQELNCWTSGVYECWIPSLKLVKIGKLCPQKEGSPPIPPVLKGCWLPVSFTKVCQKFLRAKMSQKKSKKTPKNRHLFDVLKQRPASRGTCFGNRLKSLLLILLTKRKITTRLMKISMDFHCFLTFDAWCWWPTRLVQWKGTLDDELVISKFDGRVS